MKVKNCDICGAPDAKTLAEGADLRGFTHTVSAENEALKAS